MTFICNQQMCCTHLYDILMLCPRTAKLAFHMFDKCFAFLCLENGGS